MFLEKLWLCIKLCLFFQTGLKKYLFIQCSIANISTISVPWGEVHHQYLSSANWKTSQWYFYFSSLLAEIFLEENIGSPSQINLVKSVIKSNCLLPEIVKALRNPRNLLKLYPISKCANKLVTIRNASILLQLTRKSSSCWDHSMIGKIFFLVTSRFILLPFCCTQSMAPTKKLMLADVSQKQQKLPCVKPMLWEPFCYHTQVFTSLYP